MFPKEILIEHCFKPLEELNKLFSLVWVLFKDIHGGLGAQMSHLHSSYTVISWHLTYTEPLTQ